MRTVPVLVGFILLSSSGVALAQQWLEYRPAGAGYSVELPEPPVLGTRDELTEVGPITATYASVERDDVAFITVYNDYPVSRVESLGAERILDGYRGSVSAHGRTLRSERHLMVSGYPARSMILDNEQGRIIALTVVLARYRLFQAIYVGAPGSGPGAEPGPDAIRFLDSFFITQR